MPARRSYAAAAGSPPSTRTQARQKEHLGNTRVPTQPGRLTGLDPVVGGKKSIGGITYGLWFTTANSSRTSNSACTMLTATAAYSRACTPSSIDGGSPSTYHQMGGGIYHDTQTVAHDTQSTSANIEDVTPTNAFDAVATMDNTAEQDPEQHGMAGHSIWEIWNR